MEFKVIRSVNILNQAFYEIECLISGYEPSRSGTVTDGALVENKTWFQQITRPFIQNVLFANISIFISEGGLFKLKS